MKKLICMLLACALLAGCAPGELTVIEAPQNVVNATEPALISTPSAELTPLQTYDGTEFTQLDLMLFGDGGADTVNSFDHPQLITQLWEFCAAGTDTLGQPDMWNCDGALIHFGSDACSVYFYVAYRDDGEYLLYGGDTGSECVRVRKLDEQEQQYIDTMMNIRAVPPETIGLSTMHGGLVRGYTARRHGYDWIWQAGGAGSGGISDASAPLDLRELPEVCYKFTDGTLRIDTTGSIESIYIYYDDPLMDVLHDREFVPVDKNGKFELCERMADPGSLKRCVYMIVVDYGDDASIGSGNANYFFELLP